MQKIVALTSTQDYSLLNLLNTSGIPAFPDEILIGWSEVRDDLSIDLLSNKDLGLYQSFTNESRKGEFLTGRHLFRMLAEESGWDFADHKLEKEPLGKPFVKTENRRKYVSFSHSKDLVMCAVSSTLDLGLDIETLDRKVNPEIVKRILSENEWKVLGEENPIRLWTMKEAAVKSLGTGLRTNLKDLEMKKKEDGQFEISINDKEPLNGISFDALNHCISIAY